jgi:hypothetical protein
VTVESKPRESAPVGEKRPREFRKERRHREKSQEKGQACAVTAPVAFNKPAFFGNCHNCGKPGHMKVNCTEKKPAGSGRKPRAVCNFCKKVDFHTEDECWEKNSHMKPDKWRKRNAKAKPAYAAKTLTPSAPSSGDGAARVHSLDGGDHHELPPEGLCGLCGRGPRVTPQNDGAAQHHAGRARPGRGGAAGCPDKGRSSAAGRAAPWV